MTHREEQAIRKRTAEDLRARRHSCDYYDAEEDRLILLGEVDRLRSREDELLAALSIADCTSPACVGIQWSPKCRVHGALAAVRRVVKEKK